ncbi:MAG: hypothetical protein ACREOZ_00930, partial [Gloeomargaritales cyanobacterium]
MLRQSPSTSAAAAIPSASSFWDDDSIKGLDRSKHKAPPKPALPLSQLQSPRWIPTKHSSRQFPGPTCPPSQLLSMTRQLLASEPESFTYTAADNDNPERDEDTIHAAKEQFEYVLRGYSAAIPGSYLYCIMEKEAETDVEEGTKLIEPQYQAIIKEAQTNIQNIVERNNHDELLEDETKSWSDSGSSSNAAGKMTKDSVIMSYVTNMQNLINRLEKEGELYNRAKMSVLAPRTMSCNNEEDDDDDEDEGEVLYQKQYEPNYDSS